MFLILSILVKSENVSLTFFSTQLKNNNQCLSLPGSWVAGSSASQLLARGAGQLDLDGGGQSQERCCGNTGLFLHLLTHSDDASLSSGIAMGFGCHVITQVHRAVMNHQTAEAE